MSNKVEYWLDICDEDILAVKCLLKGKRLLHAGFFCHLIAEKALKAIIAHNTGETPPKIHDLKKLAKFGNIADDLSEEQRLLLGRLMPLHIEARYVSHKKRVADTLTVEYCEKIFKETEEFLSWIKKKLGK